MRSLLIGLLMGVSTIATADPRDWAKRIPCELQTAGVASLPTLEVLQGSSPLIACDQYRSGKALTVTNDVQAVMRFSSSLTNTLWVSVTNQSYYSNSYLIQLPSLGTNATSWVYTILYYKDSAIYWTGTGRLDIKRTEVTGNSLVWQQVAGCVSTADVATAISTHNTNLTSHATLLSSYVTQAMTNGWTVSAHLDWLVRSETNGWVVSPHQAWLTAEADPNLAPALSALSNQVNTASVKATSSAGSTLNSLSGAECLRWGVGSSCAISTTDGLQVGGTLSANLFSGNGASLTNLPPSAITGLTSALATPLAYTPISTTAGGTTFTANVTSARSIYDFTASAVNVYTNNLSALSLNGTTNYAWTARINYTDTNALSTTWDSRIEWVGLASTTPDLTVTGRYEFAFSTSDGVTIQGRQVYPSVYQYSSLTVGGKIMSGVTGTWAFNYESANQSGAVTESATCYPFSVSSGQKYFYAKVYSMWAGKTGTATNLLAVMQADHYPYLADGSLRGTVYTNIIAYQATTLTENKYMLTGFSGNSLSDTVLAIGIRTGTADNLSGFRVYNSVSKIRTANELEIKAYNAGWRP